MIVRCDACGDVFDDCNVSTCCPHKGIGYCRACDCIPCVCSRRTKNPKSEKFSDKPLCDTTMTPRNPVDTCVCIERTDEMGPCDKFEAGCNGRCVYCDHEQGCHPGDL